MNLDDVRLLCRRETMIVTAHCMDRMSRRGIELSEAMRAIMTGDVIEDYPDDYPYPSALILGNRLHVVAGVGDGRLWLITAYRPDPDQWENRSENKEGEIMKCFKCKGEMRQSFTTFVTDTEDSCVVVRRVPCLQCEKCGEVAYTGDVAENLEKIVKTAKQTLTEVAVVKYPGAVA